MRAFLSFLHKLFGNPAEDHLMGAVDLSDAHYCLGLLDSTREG